MPALADEGRDRRGRLTGRAGREGGRGEHFYSVAGGSEEEGWEVSPIEGGRDRLQQQTCLLAAQ